MLADAEKEYQACRRVNLQEEIAAQAAHRDAAGGARECQYPSAAGRCVVICKNPYLDLGYYGDNEVQEAAHDEDCIICHAAAQAVCFDVPLMCGDPTRVIGFCRSCCEHILPRIVAAKRSKVPEDCRRPVWVFKKEEVHRVDRNAV